MAKPRFVTAGTSLDAALLVTLLLVLLNGLGVITCSWYLVFAPLWVPATLLVAFVVALVAAACVKVWLIDPWRNNKWRAMRREARRVARAVNH